MRLAQALYERGFITYMRTDSTTLSSQALSAARAQASALYGAEYVPAQPRLYERKVIAHDYAELLYRIAGREQAASDATTARSAGSVG